MPYLSLTPHDRDDMLRVIGASSPDDLFSDVPESLREAAKRAFEDLNGPLSEYEVAARLKKLASRNVSSESAPSFLGAGIYDHFVPAVVGAIAQRGEFLTAYTPYQAETSQGTLQVIYEFQTLLCQLTGMEMANASLYDGATALAEALIMATSITKRRRVLLPHTVSPAFRRVCATTLQGLDVELVEAPHQNGVTAALNVDDTIAAIVVQQPNFFGNLEDARALSEAAHAKGALLIAVFNPLTLGLLPPPGDYDADIAVADGQSLGLAMSFGGPGVGLFCCRKAYARFAPGRLVGLTNDPQGRRGYALTLQTREQHIRREKATSNICTNQALCALQASVYLACLGPHGLQHAAKLCHDKAHYLAARLSEVSGCSLAFDAPFFHEFALRLPRPASKVNATLRERGIIGGYDLGRDYAGMDDVMLLAVTEKRMRDEMDGLVEVLNGL